MKYGEIHIRIEELIERAGISKTKLGQQAQLQHSQVSGYCRDTVTRFDRDVLARICTVLNCSVGELLEFIPPEELQSTDEGKSEQPEDENER